MGNGEQNADTIDTESSTFSASRIEYYEEDTPSGSRRTAKAYDFFATHWTMDITTIFVIAAWYFSNIGVVLLNKYLLSFYGFKFPVFLTLCHMVACTILSYMVSLSGMVPRQGIKSKQQFFKISALALVFCGSVVCGNISLRFLPVSFNQAVGATTPFFTAIFSAIMLGNIESVNTYLALLPVVVGIILASGSEPLFHWYGFLVCVTATAARAFKSVLQGILLYADNEKLNSMNLLLFMAPISVLALVPATLILEDGAASKAAGLASENFGFVLLILFNSVMAYFVNLTNFLVTKHTSPLTLQVLGNAKGVVATVVSILIFRNPVSTAGMIGYTITIIGVILYSESKKRSAKQQKKMQIMEKDNDLVGGKQQASDHTGIRSTTGQRI
mmetsp:Transcript_18219/g.39837  ORF Transcript_18219/g.39837 Transcript_18219/m.39837 type:complete len:387 (-) Transcript_18219:248-1408(-)|eukprot:CAMPEP_0118927278 /NCGR_PEP_ID=MMETSP1169-20130426/4780_1 /TAXON_ID=36882 /ORGANISM="Pyramimonas obovata, Strain CCMP722" /LENGTH=386 /DNA_ID=CAMNT_0006869015 /DNA_START=194 /DNA_END=1354 /DNA_ORIENTATION=-